MSPDEVIEIDEDGKVHVLWTDPMNPALIQLAITEAPAIIARLRELFRAAHPGETQPTDAEVISAYQSAFVSSLAKDDNWLSQHRPADGV